MRGVFNVFEDSIEKLIAQEKREYFKQWRAANKEKTAQHRHNYWMKRALAKLNAAQNKEAKPDD